MNKFIIAAAFVGIAVLARYADAAEKTERKPMVCLSYAIAKTDRAHDDAVAICYDSKKPVLMYLFREAEVPKADGSGPVKVLVGWR